MPLDFYEPIFVTLRYVIYLTQICFYMKKIILILTTSILISGSTGIAIAGESKKISTPNLKKIDSNVD